MIVVSVFLSVVFTSERAVSESNKDLKFECRSINPSDTKGFGTTSDTKGGGGGGAIPCYLITPLT